MGNLQCFIKVTFLILCISLLNILRAQNRKVEIFERNKSISSKIPDSVASSVQKMADYLNLKFHTQEVKSKAVFEWLAQNIAYDYENKYKEPDDLSTEIKVKKILLTRKGICIDYSNLFKEISKKAGIETFVVTGYTRKAGNIIYEPHSWCASLIDSVWYFMDPTWGAILSRNNKSNQKVSLKYFKVKPKHFIRTHIPYDPLWQLLNFPISKKEFKDGRFSGSEKGEYFNYNDTIKVLKDLTELENAENEFVRIANNGITCYLDFDMLIHKKKSIKEFRFFEAESKFNISVESYNDGLILLNNYYDYKSDYYMPFKSDLKIKNMLDTIELKIKFSYALLMKIENASSMLQNYINYQKWLIEQKLNEIMEEKEKLGQYLEVAKEYRKRLEYSKKYSNDN